MPISIDIDCLKKLNEVANEIVLADLVFRGVKLFHEVDEGRKFQTFRIQLELSFQDLHVFV